MTAAMELMEKLLHEADTKFDEKLRYCQNGVATNMNIYSDRTYNLRQQIAHNPQLLNDDHFMTMLQDTETALAPEFTIRGDVDKKLTSLLCGLLKTLLRETISQQIFSLRKIQIEMVWQWYEDKKRQVLDFAIGLGREAWYGKGQAGGSSEAESATCRPMVDASSSDRGGLGITGTSVSVSSTCDQSAAHNNNNSKASAWRDDKVKTTSNYFNKLKAVVSEAPRAAPAKDLTIHDESAKSSDAANIAKKFCLYKKRNLGKAEKLRQEFAGQHPVATAAATTSGSQAPPSGSNTGGGGGQQEVRVVYTKDAKARQKKVAEAKSSLVVMRHGPSGPSSFLHHDDGAAPFFTRERTLENAVATAQLHVVRHLTHRLAQESDRRELKDTMTLFDFNKSRLEEETNRRMESEEYSSQLGRNCHTNVRRPAATETAPMHFGVGVNGKSAAAESSALLGHVVYTGAAVSLSPYDVRKPSRMDETRLQEYLKKLKTPSSRLSAFASDPRSIIGGSAVNIKLDVALAPEVKVTTCGPRVDVPIVDLLLGSSDGDSVVPSLRRLDELKLANRVREAFAFSDGANGKGGALSNTANGLKSRPNSAGSQHHYSRAKIEAAIVTPDDLSYDECLRLLPTYGSFLPRRPATAKK